VGRTGPNVGQTGNFVGSGRRWEGATGLVVGRTRLSEGRPGRSGRHRPGGLPRDRRCLGRASPSNRSLGFSTLRQRPGRADLRRTSLRAWLVISRLRKDAYPSFFTLIKYSPIGREGDKSFSESEIPNSLSGVECILSTDNVPALEHYTFRSALEERKHS
jgi:hypothetical protein